jgi:hypothetical protein
MAKTIINEIDPFIYKIRTREESIDLFGEDYIDEFGFEVPDELIEEFKKTYDKLIELSKIAERIYNETGK